MRTRAARRWPNGFFDRAKAYTRLPGSAQPFKRLKDLMAAAEKAHRAKMTAVEKLKSLLGKGFWKNLLTVVVPKLEKKQSAALAGGKEEFSEADEALLKSGKDLMAYKSRGHGRGAFSPRFGAARSKHQPHQGRRECDRRRAQSAI
jgi:hypothetical protein